ncbi:hypothetical protein AY599_13530 [Leptolyngbya valderiana BDU 20041]|nr:hypothetical protein AY599_13530 [Leptolyngbya valderiana BDU 20041]
MLTARLHTLTTIALAALALAGWFAPAANAQPRDVEPYFVTVTADQAFLRSGDLRSYYPIATLKPGTVLRVTGETDRWLRVEYPKGLHALVRADHATLNQAEGMVTLSRSGALKALSDTRYGVDGSFRDVQGPETPATTRLKHHRTETSSRGVVFYVVDAPKGAAGFIESAHARRAVPSEIQAYRASLESGDEQSGDQKPAQPQGQAPAQDQTQDQPNQPADAQPTQPTTGDRQGSEPTSEETTPTVMEPMRIEGAGTPPPSDPTQAQPTTRPTNPATETPAGQPVEIEMRTEPAQPGDALDPLPSLDALSAAFDAVRRQGTLEAEVDELEAAFQRVLANTPDNEDNASVRAWLQQRLSLLEIRKQLQQTLQDVAEAQARLKEGNQESNQAMARLRDSAIYDYVGKLEKSAVYNGNRLPLMYRLVSVGEGAPRTLGYIEPKEGLDLERKLGVLVGVSGGGSKRADLRLSTIDATNVVVLRSEESEKVQYATEPGN